MKQSYWPLARTGIARFDAKPITSPSRFVMALGGLALLGTCAVLVGPRGVRADEFLGSLIRDGVHGWAARVLFHLRLPRVIVAATTGAALSMAGAGLQTWLRNPIADAGVLGISTWGALGAVVVSYTGLAERAEWLQPIGAAATALLALSALLASARRRLSPDRVLLFGIGVGALGSSLVTLVLCLSLPDWKASQLIVIWLLGGLDGKTWVHAGSALALALLGTLFLFTCHRDLDALRLGPVEAASLGVDVPRFERRLLLATGLLAGAAAAAAGAIGFVGIIVPHWVRGRTAPRHLPWLVESAIFGAAFLVLADTLARVAPVKSDIQLGVITGLLGAPLVVRRMLMSSEVHS